MIRKADRVSRIKRRSVDQTMWIFLGYFLVFILLFKLAPNILGALTLGWYLSMIIEVPARFLSRIKFIPYKLATIVASVLVLALLILGISLLIPILIDEGKRFLRLMTTGVQNFNLAEMFNIDNEAVMEQVVSVTDSFLSNIGERAASLGRDAINWVVQNVPNVMTAVLIFVIAASYFTVIIPKLKANFHRFFPRSGREKALAFASAFYGDLQHFIGGQVIIALIVGVLMGVGMAIAGVKYALFLGFLAGITNFIPFLGVIIAGIPAILVGLTHGGLWGLGKVLIVIIFVNQVESWVLSPRIQGRRMRLNWFAIIVAIFFCAQFLGIVGVLLAVPLLIFFRDFWTLYVQRTFDRM